MFVQSKYKSNWKGVVLKVINRENLEPLFVVLILKDRLGNKPRKRILKKYSSFWFIKIKEIDISNYNKDWLCIE